MSDEPSKLRMRRLRKGLKLDQVSQATGIDRSELSRLERRRGRVSVDKLAALAAFYGATLETMKKECATLSRPESLPSAAPQEVA